MINIAVLTATRAEYGLMRPLLQRMKDDPEINMSLWVTGTHLSSDFGLTYLEIEKDGFNIEHKIDILSKKSGTIGLSETIANAILQFTPLLEQAHPDFIFIDGDRYEALAVSMVAVSLMIPIIHNGGGAISEGALDDYWRHAITKLSLLHFTSTELYRRRIIQMGEAPDRVFAVGSMGIENIINMKLLTKRELEDSLDFQLDKPYAVVTFHPATMEAGKENVQIEALFHACDHYSDMKFIFTKANADKGGDAINKLLEQYVKKHSSSSICIASLGALRYLSALKYSDFVMGNSSSGLIEAPSMHIPTVNIGNRQGGRIMAESVISCSAEGDAIIEAMELARSDEFHKICKSVVNPNGDGNTSAKILYQIKKYVSEKKELTKKFFDIESIYNIVDKQ